MPPGIYNPKARKKKNQGRRAKKLARQSKIFNLMKNDPSLTNRQIGKIVGCNASTVSRDKAIITEHMKNQCVEDWLIARQIIIDQIDEKMAMCERRMKALRSRPHQGSRWLEMWHRLMDMKIKILGLYAPDRLEIDETVTFNKAEEDAAVDALIAGIENAHIIDVAPKALDTEIKIDKDIKDDDMPDPTLVPQKYIPPTPQEIEKLTAGRS
jgi:hypothetical protein